MDAVRNQPPQTTDDLDADRLQEWMYSAVEGFAGPLQVMRFAGGQSNPTYQVRTPARHYVLRRKPPGRLLASAHAIDREYRVMNALGKAGFSVPHRSEENTSELQSLMRLSYAVFYLQKKNDFHLDRHH